MPADDLLGARIAGLHATLYLADRRLGVVRRRAAANDVQQHDDQELLAGAHSSGHATYSGLRKRSTKRSVLPRISGSKTPLL